MGKRIRLGLIYIWDETWLGGVYYLQNLVKALDNLEDEKKPIIDVHCFNTKSFEILKTNTNYPYLEMRIVKNKLSRRIIRKLISYISESRANNIDMFGVNPHDDIYFPYERGYQTSKNITWKPDFQEKYLPQYFSETEIANRECFVRSACERGVPIVFSSNDCQNDFKRFYSEYVDHPTYVVHFAVNQPDFSDVMIDDVMNKHGIRKPYLICPNQFWQHKNHLFLFKAFKKGLEEGLELQLVCTGKMEDFRRPEYVEEIKSYLAENHLTQDILTLGVIDKRELLSLMKHSYAVIQPSLFEGWNTTVEDCKAMNKFLFLSDLKVHREQVNENVCFFDPRDEEDLVQKLLTVLPEEDFSDYYTSIRQFGEDFYRVIESRCRRK